MRCLEVGLAAMLLVASAPAWSGTVCTDDDGEPNPTYSLESEFGPIVFELCIEDAPETVANFQQYVDDGAYTDSGFIHRSATSPAVIQGGGYYVEAGPPDFMRAVETRDPIPFESTGLTNDRGTVAMARMSDPDSATSQWFINVEDNPALDQPTNNFAVFAEVVVGMDDISDPQNPILGAVDTIFELETCALNPPLSQLPRTNAHPCGSNAILDHLVYLPEPSIVAQLAAGVALLGSLARRRGVRALLS